MRADRESRQPASPDLTAELAAVFLQHLPAATAVVVSDYDKGVVNRDLLAEILPKARIAGVPVGREIQEQRTRKDDVGSIIVVVATDAPLIPTQLKRLTKRVSLGLGRNGSYSGDGSGDIFIAFSTANPGAAVSQGLPHLTMLPNGQLDPLFLATVQATEEAIINAMVAAETMTGINNRTVIALPHGRLREVLKKYNRLEK